jgi:acetyl esterase/lipase
LRIAAGPAIIAATFFAEKFVMRSRLPVAAILAIAATAALAQQPAWQPASGHTQVPIWPNGAPGAAVNAPAEIDTTTAKDNLISGKPLIRLGNVSLPTITYYAPTEGGQVGPRPAVVVFPGGGYHILAIDLEGTEVCDWFNLRGIACVLLKYRVPDSGPYPKSAAALQDAQRAVGLVRQHAKEWNIDPNKVGVLGFSAGGHLVAALSTHFDKRLYDPVDAADQLSCRPDFAVLVYPGYLALADQNMATNPEIHPTAETPPTFIVQAEDDPVHVENATNYFLQLKNAKVPAELHIFAEGGHGYGLRRREIQPGMRPTVGLPVTEWPELVTSWLDSIKMISPLRE